MKTWDSRYMHQNEPDKACLQLDMGDWDFKDLPRRTDAGKVLQKKSLHSTKNPKEDGYQRGLASILCKFSNKKSSASGVKSEITPNQELAE